MDTQQVIILAAGLAFLLVLTILPQWRARKRRERQTAELQIGDEVITVGGIIGRLTFLDPEQNRARLEIAPGVEMRVVMAAISRPIVPSEES